MQDHADTEGGLDEQPIRSIGKGLGGIHLFRFLSSTDRTVGKGI